MEEREEDSATALSAAATLASEIQIREFKVKVDAYDSATVTALMENQELLDAVNKRLEAMLARAHVLEDGRRVFRTEDGTQVFDEHGLEVTAEEINPDSILPDAPTWEVFSAGLEEQSRLQAERTEIIEFQEKVDATRERVDAGQITEAEVEELNADLLESMPDTIKRHVPGLEFDTSQNSQLQTDTTHEFQPKASNSFGQPRPLNFGL